MTETFVAGSFKSILIHVDADDGTAGRVRLSARLAASFDAVLISAAATEEETMAADRGMLSMAPAFPPPVAEHARVEHRLANAEAIFRRNALGLRRLEWRPAHAGRTRHLPRRKRRSRPRRGRRG